MLPPDKGPISFFQPGQTLIFVGDHTSPDDPGFVQIISGVLSRFHPQLNLNLISAGAKGQGPSGLMSQAMMDILSSSHPDWLVIGVGTTDAWREPVTADLVRKYQQARTQDEEIVEATFGPEYRANLLDTQPSSDIGKEPLPDLVRLDNFRQNLTSAVTQLGQVGVRSILLTTALLGNEIEYPINSILTIYSRAIRDVAHELETPLVDVERAFRNIYDRAATYKQKVSLSGLDGKLNAQGQTLIARTFLDRLDLLPPHGFRPLR